MLLRVDSRDGQWAGSEGLTTWAHVVLTGVFVLGCTHSVMASGPVTITADVAFSTLDGGPLDDDGLQNGVFSATQLTVVDAHLIIDVPVAQITVEQHFRLRRAHIGPVTAPPVGPTIAVEAGQHIFIGPDSHVSVEGTQAAGALRLCSGQHIHVRRGSTITADCVAQNGTGGAILLQADGHITLHRWQRYVSASGGHGGSIRMISCASGLLDEGDDNDSDSDSDSDSENRQDSDSGDDSDSDSDSDNGPDGFGEKIFVRGGDIRATGFDGPGGSIDLLAPQGAIFVSGGSTLIDATGATVNGTITIAAAGRVDVLPSHVNPAAQVISNAPFDMPCEPCTTTAPGGECTTDSACDDGDPCTSDTCVSNTCQHAIDPSACDDGDACTTNDTCTDGVCSGEAVDCDDGNVCTNDDCDSVAGCTHQTNTADCNDGNSCTENDTCAGGFCDGTTVLCSDDNPCTDDQCSTVTGCQFTPNAATCDDHNACTQNDVCASGACEGTPLDCDDNNPCTDDGCDPVIGCEHSNNVAPCNDGVFCTSDDVCANGECQGFGESCPGQICDEANNTCSGCLDDGHCDDGNPCTDDGCVSSHCENTPNTSGCDDGLFCTATDICAEGLCIGSGDTCTPQQSCDEVNDMCVDCLADSDCDDGHQCTTNTCVAGACAAVNHTLSCDDGLFCTANDVCADGACVGSGDPCQGQICDESNNICATCLSAAECDDSNPCTSDACNAGSCTNTPNTGSCDDGLFCTVTDSCVQGACMGSGTPCTDEPCDEQRDACGDFAPPAPDVDAHPPKTTATTVNLSGAAPQAGEVRVDGYITSQTVPVVNGLFSADVPLKPQSINTIYFTSIDAGGLASAPATTYLTHDTQPPHVVIDYPGDGDEFTAATTDVVGRVGDMLTGEDGLTLLVNGIPAEMNAGIGNNGTFIARDVPLPDGQPTLIVADATDCLGNAAQATISVIHTPVSAGVAYLEMVSGNGQTAPIGSVLLDPIVVRLYRGDGSPFANKIVTFHVDRSDGRLTDDGLGVGAMIHQVRADADGLARAYWQLGSDAGSGNNRVRVTSRDVRGTAVFCASATPGPAKQINVSGGDNQRCEAGAPAPESLRARVSDGCNGLTGINVTFSVVRGTGQVNGQSSATVLTGPTGHVEVEFTAGAHRGSNLISATFAGNPNAPAEFNVWGEPRDPAKDTSFYGVVLDNANRPIGGATCTLTVRDLPALVTITGSDGQFLFSDTEAGPADLFIDGSTAITLDGAPISAGSFPKLHFMPVLVPNVANCLPTPALLPWLNPDNGVIFDNTCGVELTVDGIEGLKMIVASGSMTRADGTIPSPDDPATLSINQVDVDEIPMPMPDGAAPPFAWTLQPGGATFDPPIRIVYPNMAALAPGSLAYFLSFNHDTNRFEVVATGRVNEEGSLIESDPGVGIATAGWGGICPPYPITGDVEKDCPDDMPDCEDCPEIAIDSLVPTGTLPLGTDLTVNYTVDKADLESCTLEVMNNNGDVVFTDSTLPTSVGTHVATWSQGKWNDGVSYANPGNGPYLVTVSGSKGLCFPNGVASIDTALRIRFDVTDDPPTGSTVSRTAGVGDTLGALKIVLRSPPAADVVLIGPIDSADITNGVRLTVSDPQLNQLVEGTYDVILQDCRDAIGNFTDDNSDTSDGAETTIGTLEIH